MVLTFGNRGIVALLLVVVVHGKSCGRRCRVAVPVAGEGGKTLLTLYSLSYPSIVLSMIEVLNSATITERE